jgi:hypothetical protein
MKTLVVAALMLLSSESLCDRLAEAFISNWPLVVVGLIGIFVAWLTLRDIHTQAEETAKATRAMRDSLPLQKALLTLPPKISTFTSAKSGLGCASK